MSLEIDKNRVPSPEIFKILSKEEQEAILQLNSIKSFKKGDHLIKEGAYFTESYFVVEGCIRQYRLIDGDDKTSDFYMENESVFIASSSNANKVSKFNLECLEDCRISVVSFTKEKEIYHRFPRFEKMCRITSEKQLLEFQERFAKFISSSPEERYLDLLKNKANLIDRVPQYHLASYLGVKPESLSRIRKRLAKR